MATMVAGHPRRAAEKQINERALCGYNQAGRDGVENGEEREQSRAAEGRRVGNNCPSFRSKG